MKTFHTESWINYRRITPGRRSRIARKIKQVAEAQGYAHLLPLCEAIIAAEAALGVLHVQFKRGQALATDATWSPEVLALDVTLDRLLGELRDLLVVLAKRVGTPRGAAAKALFDEHFSLGLTWYTQQSIEDESVRVELLLHGLAAQPAVVEQATVDDVVAEITQVHTDYATQVNATVKAHRLDYDVIKTMDLANHRRLLDLFAEILVLTRRMPDPECQTAREALLEEAIWQDEAVADYLRERRRVKDVHPETGETES